jgi:RIP homotypic interaction motif
MNEPTDSEIRGQLLKALYRRRREGRLAIPRTALFEGMDSHEVVRISKQLADPEFRLISWADVGGIGSPEAIPFGLIEITAKGIDVVEGTSRAPLTINLDRRMTVTVSNSSGVQIGEGNQQHTGNLSLGDLRALIDAMPGESANVKEVKGFWNRLLDSPALASVLGGLVSNLKF